MEDSPLQSMGRKRIRSGALALELHLSQHEMLQAGGELL